MVRAERQFLFQFGNGFTLAVCLVKEDAEKHMCRVEFGVQTERGLDRPDGLVEFSISSESKAKVKMCFGHLRRQANGLTKVPFGINATPVMHRESASAKSV